MYIETERLIIRRFTESDFGDFAELIRDKMASPYAIYDNTYPTDHDGLRTVLGYLVQSDDEFYAAAERRSGRVIGFVTLNNLGEDAVRNLGYCLHTRFQGQGLGTEAVSRVIRYAREDLGLRKLISATAAVNIPSVRLLEKLGFVKTGEHTGSFAIDEGGDPIEFTGYSYERILP